MNDNIQILVRRSFGSLMGLVQRVTEKKVAELKAAGETIHEISRKMGMPRSSVYSVLARPNVQEMVNVIQEKFLQENLPVATQNIHDIVHKKVKKLGDRRLQFDASRDVLKSVGMLPTTEQSIVVQQMFQQNNIVLNPVVQGILDKHLNSLMNFKGDVVEGEIINKEIINE